MLFISGNQNRTTKSSQISSFSRIPKKRTLDLIKRIISEKFIQNGNLITSNTILNVVPQIKPIFAIMFDSNIELLCITLQNLSTQTLLLDNLGSIFTIWKLMIDDLLDQFNKEANSYSDHWFKTRHCLYFSCL